MTRRMAKVLMTGVASAGLLSVGACSGHRAPPPRLSQVPATAPAACPVPMVQAIRGTTLRFELAPLVIGDRGDLWIATTEVTWDLYDLFVYRTDLEAAGAGPGEVAARPSKPYLPPDRGYGHAGYPAISMSYHAAQRFCEWLTRLTGNSYRLPTEAEWIEACRRGFSSCDVTPDSLAWHAQNAAGTTHPVAGRAPDAIGLHDVAGNVAEWCTGADGRPVVLGGSFRDPAGAVGCGHRQEPSAAWNASDPQIPRSAWWLADCPFVGFRVVCEGVRGGATAAQLDVARSN